MQISTETQPYDSINVTPMLDLAYVLLVVFILMTTASVQGLNISMPKPSNKPSTERHELRIVQVMPGGALLVNGAPVTLQQLEQCCSREALTGTCAHCRHEVHQLQHTVTSAAAASS